MSLPTTFANISFPVILTTLRIQRSLNRPAIQLPCYHELQKPLVEILMHGSFSVKETSTEAQNGQYNEKLPVFLLLHQKPSVCDRSNHLCTCVRSWQFDCREGGKCVSAFLREVLVFMKLNSLTFLCMLIHFV